MLAMPRLVGLFAVALFLRLGGIAFGLPYVFHADEPVHVGEAVRLMTGTNEALSFANPALYKYMLVGLFGLLVGEARLAEVGDGSLYLLARVSSAVFGALTIFAVYSLGRLVRDERTGQVGAGLAAATFLLVRESHFAVNDALATLCSTVALIFIVVVARRGARADYLAAGATLGLAFAAKYQTAALLVPLGFAHVVHRCNRRHVDLLLALLMSMFTAVVAFPPLVTETLRVAGDAWVDVVLPGRQGWPGLDPAGGYSYYVDVLKWGVGWPMVALGCAALVWAVVRRDWPVLVVASLPVCLFVVMGGSHTYFARYLLPAVPALVVLTAAIIGDLSKGRRPIAFGLTVVALAWTVPNSMRFDLLLTRIDTRTAAREWMKDHVPAGARVAVERVAIGPPLADLPLELLYSPDNEIFSAPLESYRAEGAEYVITSSLTAEEYVSDPALAAQRAAFYATLSSQADQLVEFRPYHGSEPKFMFDRGYGPFDALDSFDQPGPTITIYRLTG